MCLKKHNQTNEIEMSSGQEHATPDDAVSHLKFYVTDANNKI
jgi:hypothetical protein